MLADVVAERYGRALLRAAQAEGRLDEVAAEAAGLAAALAAGGARVAEFLRDPVAEPGAKLDVLKGAFAAEPQSLTAGLLAAVIGNRRESFLPAILAEFLDLADAAQGRLKATLGTARPLEDAAVAALGEALGRTLGLKVALRNAVDPALLGGAVLRMGDLLYDGSVRDALARLRRSLAADPGPAAEAAPVR